MNEWFFKVLEATTHESKKAFFSVLWAVWKERNERVWNWKFMVEEVVVKLGMDQIEEWTIAQNSKKVAVSDRRDSTCRRWHRLEAGVVKVNVDAAISREPHCHGLAATSGNSTPQEAKARCLAQALHWPADMGWNQVCFETNCQLVQQALVRQTHDATEFGVLISDCRRLLENQPLSKVRYVRRESNRIADALAKRSMYETELEIGE
ncbi:hypothetical protein LINPERPRIM_LOCUS38631, partial [Linum perenne]